MPVEFGLVLLEENSHKIEAMGHEDARKHWRKAFGIDTFFNDNLWLKLPNLKLIFFVSACFKLQISY